MNDPVTPTLPDGQEYAEGHVVFECSTASLIQTVIQSLSEVHPQKGSLCAFLMAFYEGQLTYNAGYLLHQLGIIEQTHRGHLTFIRFISGGTVLPFMYSFTL